MVNSPSIRPPGIPARPTIRVVHPAGSVGEHLVNLHAGIERLEALGCTVRWDPRRGTSIWRDYYAGDDATRAQEFIDALREPDVDIVWFARGGSGCHRIVSAICDAAQSATKIVIGLGDATAVLNALNQEVGWVTFHGPVMTSLGGHQVQTDAEMCLRLLSGEIRSIDFEASASGAIDGILLGGNLTVLASSLGGPTGIQSRPDSIWLLEDVGEAPYRLERSLWQLVAAGTFQHAKGIWCGDLDLDCAQGEDMVARFQEDTKLRVYRGAPAGHRGTLSLCPIGLKIRIDTNNGRLSSPVTWVDVQ